jgi:hypothetical protein
MSHQAISKTSFYHSKSTRAGPCSGVLGSSAFGAKSPKTVEPKEPPSS